MTKLLTNPSPQRVFGVTEVNRLVTELDSSRRSRTAFYLRNATSELFTLTKLKELGIAPGIVMVATSPVESISGDKPAP